MVRFSAFHRVVKWSCDWIYLPLGEKKNRTKHVAWRSKCWDWEGRSSLSLNPDLGTDFTFDLAVSVSAGLVWPGCLSFLMWRFDEVFEGDKGPSGFPWWLRWWRICLQFRRRSRLRFHPWIRKIPWRRKWQREELGGPRSMGVTVRHNWNDLAC